MPETRPNLLFVCIENSNRSQMAEGFARTLGKGRVSAFSAGSRPAGQINPRAVQFMKEEGIDLTVQLSKGLDDLPKIRWDWIVTMGCGGACPHASRRPPTRLGALEEVARAVPSPSIPASAAAMPVKGSGS
jgi:arsenate reductase